MDNGIDAAARAKARSALRNLLDSAAGPRLPARWRPLTASGLARAVIGIGGLLIALSMFGVLSAAYLLAKGPINLESLKPRIVASLEEKLGERYKVTLGPTHLMRAPGGFGLGFGGISIEDREGRTVVAAPSGRVGLDLLSLLTLDVKVRRLELDGLVLKLRVAPNGELSMAAARSTDAATFELRGPPPAGGARGPVNPNLVAVALIDALAGSAQPLDHVTLAHGHLEVENQALGKSSVYEDFSVAYDKGVDSATVAVSARGPAGPWSFSANAHAGPELRLTAEARDLSLDDILLLNARRPPFESDMPISFKFDASLTREGAMKSMQGGFGLGAGYFRLDDPDHEPFLVDEATGRFGWDADAGRFRLDGLEALAGASHFRINGWLGPPVGDDGAWRAHLQTNDSVFGPERPGDLPVPIDQATFDARFAPSQNRFVLDGFAVHGPRLQGEMKAEVAAQGRRLPETRNATRRKRTGRGHAHLAELHQCGSARLVPGTRARRRPRLRNHESRVERRRIRRCVA